MTIAQKIARVSAGIESGTRSAEFIHLARILLQSQGRLSEAKMIAQQSDATARVIQSLKTTATVGTTVSGDTEALIAFNQLSSGFVRSLELFSSFDKISATGGFLSLPVLTRISVTTVAGTAAAVAEGTAKTVTDLQIGATQLEPRRVAAIIVLSEELVRTSHAGGIALIGDELRRAVGKATDDTFLSNLAGTFSTSVASTGLSAAAFATDLDAALAKLAAGSRSNVYLIASARTVRTIAMMRAAGGAPSYPQMSINGGQIVGGVTVVPSDSDAVADEMVLLDASSVAADATLPVAISGGDHATLDLAGTGTPNFSVWQKNARALKCERRFAFEVLRNDSVVVITGVTA